MLDHESSKVIFMDPKNASSLDPKLREAYDRVMGFSVPGASPKQQKVEPKPQASAPVQAQPPQQQPSTMANYQVTDTPEEQQPAQKEEKKGSKVIPLAFLFGGIILLVLYAIFWMRFLNVQLF